MLCFRRAVREFPQAYDARYHLGEMLWTLGRLHDALACWRECVRIAPDQPAAHQALAEALLGLGETSEASASAAHLLTRNPDDARAGAIVAIASFAQTPVESARAIVAAIERDPAIVTVVAIAGPLAQLLDRSGSAESARMLDAVIEIDASAERVAAMPALLIALACEHAAAAGPAGRAATERWIAAACARPWTPGDHDALRRIARVAVSHAAHHADGLRSHYARLCVATAGGSAKLGWPHRTRGERLRVVVLVADDDELVQSVLGSMEALALDRFDVRTVALHDVGRAEGDPSHRITVIDPDVLIDLAGLACPTGLLLVQRPARAQVTLRSFAAHNVLPLVDHVFENERELVDVLRAMSNDLSKSARDGPDAAAIDALWSRAVERHRQGDHSAARADYEQVLEAQPGFGPAHYLIANLLREGGEIAGARMHLDAALTASPDHLDARVAAIRAAADAGAFAEAERLANDGAARTGDPPAALLRAWGSARLAAHDGAGAGELFEAALAREPQDGETHYNHGVALQMQRRNVDAARAYQRALAFRPGSHRGRFQPGRLVQCRR